MMIGSHTLYVNNCYKKMFRYLSRDDDGYALKAGELTQRMQERRRHLLWVSK